MEQGETPEPDWLDELSVRKNINEFDARDLLAEASTCYLVAELDRRSPQPAPAVELVPSVTSQFAICCKTKALLHMPPLTLSFAGSTTEKVGDLQGSARPERQAAL